MNPKSKKLNHPRVETLIRELSQLMGPGAKSGMFEEMFTDLALIGSGDWAIRRYGAGLEESDGDTA